VKPPEQVDGNSCGRTPKGFNVVIAAETNRRLFTAKGGKKNLRH